MTGFSCVACRERFASRDEMRVHFSSLRHRQTVERRVAAPSHTSGTPLAPSTAPDAPSAAGQRQLSFTCCVCRKSYSSTATMDAHRRSAQHKEAMKRAAAASTPGADRPAEVEVREKRAENEDLTKRDCFFCDCRGVSMRDNLAHMESVHGFVLPMRDYLIDEEGLVSYLAQRTTACLCLYCGERGRRFWSLPAVRDHMTRKRHRLLDWEGCSEEYEDFYNLPGPRPEPIITENGGLVLGRGKVARSVRGVGTGGGPRPAAVRRPLEPPVGESGDAGSGALVLTRWRTGPLAVPPREAWQATHQFSRAQMQRLATATYGHVDRVVEERERRQWVRLGANRVRNPAMFRGY